MIISPNFAVNVGILLLLHVFPKPLSHPLSGDMDHKANHPAGFTVARLVALIRLHDGNQS
jgi:hypothetical protein